MKDKIADMEKKETILTVKVTPRASKSAFVGWEGDIFKVRLKANPEKGEANDELIEFLSEHFSIPKSRIHLIRGHKSRLKQVKIEGVSLIKHSKG